MSQFFYTYTVTHNTTGEKTTFTGSFELNEVLQSFQVNENEFAIVLKDGHEESRVVGKNKQNGFDRIREWKRTEIFMDGENYARFANVYGHAVTTITKTELQEA